MHCDDTRSEAKTVPNLLVAPNPSTSQTKNDGLYADYPQGYYADGAYTATPFPSTLNTKRRDEPEEVEDLDPQDAYYTSLCARFSKLSAILQEPPPSSVDVTSRPTPTYKRRQWRNKILKVTPKPTTLAQIPQDAVIVGLEVLEDILSASNLRSENGKNIGAWAWGLLARCRDMGTMGSEEVGVLRTLGKKAVWLLRRIAAGEVVEEEVVEGDDTNKDSYEDEDEADIDIENHNAEDHEIDLDISPQTNSDPLITTNLDAPPPTNEGDETTLLEAKQRILSLLEPTPEIQPEQTTIPSTNLPEPKEEEKASDGASTPSPPADKAVIDKEAIHATLDMIVTIVGEFYGQRDLLDGRLLWGEMG